MRSLLCALTLLAVVLSVSVWREPASAQALCTPMGDTMECTDMGMNPGASYSVPFDRYDYSGYGSTVVPGGSTSAGRDLGSGLRAVPGPSYGYDTHSRSSSDWSPYVGGPPGVSKWSPWVLGPPGMTDHSSRR